ncbi:MAG TPA: hypothetical protein DCK95_11635 [Anaerolineaceae bacterium]|nr:hypothetical protein [Anaerolineaceae bacterium]
MKVSQQVRNILQAAASGIRPSREDCILLLDFPEFSPESALLRATADALSRARFYNHAMLLAQIGIEIAPCLADCQFCSFAESYTDLPSHTMELDEILLHSKNLTEHGNLHSLFLMTMHTFDFEHLLQVVQHIRKHISPQVHVVVNIGDFNLAQAEELRAAGVNGAYHVRRLREGIDNTLQPTARLRTVEAIRSARLDWYTCCEPIGPEHNPTEIVDQIFESYDFGCFQNAAMRRVALPKSPLAANGQISELRLAQIVSVVTLAGLECKELKSIAVHEPNALGLVSGANCIYAEAGANPRDTRSKTEQSRGLGLLDCEELLLECGFSTLMLPDQKYVTISARDIVPHSGTSPSGNQPSD